MRLKQSSIFLIFTLLMLFFFSFNQQSSAASKESTAIKKAISEIKQSEPYTKKVRLASTYKKTKNGTEYIELYEVTSERYLRIASYKFIKKYGQKRLYKLDLVTDTYSLAKVYALSSGKNSKALSNKKAAKLLTTVKVKTKQGKTAKTKNLKVGTSYKNIKKQLGQPKKVSIPYTSVVYNYPNTRIFLDSVWGKETWAIDRNGYTRMIQVTQPKNQFLKYGQIKKKFGKSKLIFDRDLGLHYIMYDVGNYTVAFASNRFTAFQYQGSEDIISLNDSLKFNSYFVVSFN